MQTLDAIRTRHSTREFAATTLAREAIEKLVEAGSLAPTARNVQPWEFIVVTRKDILEKIAEFAENGRFIKQASCCIAVVCKETKYYLEDGCAATENILLAAADTGLATCWVAGDKKPYCQDIKNLLGVPADCMLVSLIAVGKEKSKEVASAPKRPLKELLHWEKF